MRPKTLLRTGRWKFLTFSYFVTSMRCPVHNSRITPFQLWLTRDHALCVLFHDILHLHENCVVLFGSLTKRVALTRVTAKVEYNRPIPMVPHVSSGHIHHICRRTVVYSSSQFLYRSGPGPEMSLNVEYWALLIPTIVPCIAPSGLHIEDYHDSRTQGGYLSSGSWIGE